MRKICLILVVALVIFGVCACSKRDNKAVPTTTPVADTPVQETVDTQTTKATESETVTTPSSEKNELTVPATPSPSPEPSPEPAPESSPEPKIEPRENTDFRYGYWGDDPDTIEQYEQSLGFKVNKSKNGDIVIKDITVAGQDGNALYSFDKDFGLYKGIYHFEGKFKAAYDIGRYNDLKDSLNLVYGEPLIDEIKKIDSLADYADVDTALTLGYVIYHAEWETESTKIMLAMSAESYINIMTIVEYDCKEYEVKPDTSGL